MTLDEARAILERDGRFAWLVQGRAAWSIADLVAAYQKATDVTVSSATVLRWIKRLPAGGAENYGGTLGWRARRDALILFFASGRHLRGGSRK
jgi:hypothetical protein